MKSGLRKFLNLIFMSLYWKNKKETFEKTNKATLSF